MAIPKIFISSTCYDLMQIRDSLSEFIQEYYYEPVLSEKGDVFYHPDLHTHESCIGEIENCDMFILIIGGRFGGKYKSDEQKSITNAEYEAAKVRNIPVFTFVKREVYEDHRVYQRNKKNSAFVKKIEFPSIEKQENSVNIFEFINKVRLAKVNNGFFSFEFVNEIKDHLGKQWAGLMFDFLNSRLKYKDQKVVNQTLDNLTLINRKTEELVENIYRKLSPDTAQDNIDTTDKIISGSKFYNRVLNLFDLNSFSSKNKKINEIDPDGKEWYQYLACMNEFELIHYSETEWYGHEERKNKEIESWIKHFSKEVYWGAKRTDEAPPLIKEIIGLYKIVSTLTKLERTKALEMTIANKV